MPAFFIFNIIFTTPKIEDDDGKALDGKRM